MKHIISNKLEKKLARKRKLKEWWFKHTVYKTVKKTISKFLYEYRYHTGTNTNQIFMLPYDFKKYSNEQIEFSLDMLKTHAELEHWARKTIENEDGYLLIISSQNRSHARFSNRFLEEINLNDVKVEPVTQNEQQKQQIAHPEQSIQDEELPAEKMLDAQIQVHSEQSVEPTKQQEVAPKRKSVWDD